MTRHPLYGLALAGFGALILTPDTLFMRWSGMDGFQMLAWRGLLMGAVLITLWLFGGAQGRRALRSRAGIAIILCHALNATLFSLGIAMAPVPVVLFGVATVPVFAALFARLVGGEATGRATWIATAAVLAGIAIAVFGSESGDITLDRASVLGAVAGLGVAAMLALSFVIIRHARAVPIMPAIGSGAMLAGLAGLALSGGPVAAAAGNIAAIAVSGLVILPASFLALTQASRHTAAANVSLLLLLETVLGPVWVYAFAGEPLTAPMILGGAVVVASLALYITFGSGRPAFARASRRTPRPPHAP
ncbi:DMT family transporter [Defluviimonas sp. SAOS-178_SWC]|uniref:DMT family transporter n=1 Tax=Defluviimonas sp. SAOS-178_SWC TaxID=3121287 RepID=UPI003221E408